MTSPTLPPPSRQPAASVAAAPDPVELLLGRVVQGRGSTDPVQRAMCREAWHQLVGLEHDRVRALVAVFRFPEHPDVVIAEHDRDDAVQDAFGRLLRMLDTFRGTSAGEFRAAVRTATGYACMDFCRRALARDRQIAGSLQEPARDETGGRFDHAIFQQAVREYDQRQQLDEKLGELALAVDKLVDRRQREIVRLSLEGWSTDEIAGAINTSAANVHQLRSRAMRHLRATL